MSYFIIIRGPAGIGKSTIAMTLAKLLNCSYISFDTILAENRLDYIEGEKCVPEVKMLAANKIVIPLAQKNLGLGKIVIFDGNFYHKSQIEDLITKLNWPYFVFTLKAGVNTCLARNKTRANQLDQQAIEDVFKLVSSFNYGVLIDTNNKSISEIVHEIVTHLQKEYRLLPSIQ